MPTKPSTPKAESQALVTSAAKSPQPVKRVTINVGLPTDIHRSLRIKAFSADLTMQEAVTQAVVAWIKAK